MTVARILAMILKKEMKDLGQEVGPKDSQIVFLRSWIDSVEVVSGWEGQNAEIIQNCTQLS